MDSVIAALKDTPIPTILVVAGIAFLLLAVAGQIAGRIVVAPERQRWSAIIGGGLLAIGVALSIHPEDRSKTPAPDQGSTKEQVTHPSGVSPPMQSPVPQQAEPIASLPTAGHIEAYRIRTNYLGPSNIEFAVFVNDVQVGDYSTDGAIADISRYIKPGLNDVKITWTGDPNMGPYAQLIIEAKQGEQWNAIITRQVTKNTKAGESTAHILNAETKPQ
jgi:hypothetical protein